MNITELTDLLVTSSQRFSQAKFIPWWEDDYENCSYYYEILSEETVQDANACIAACGKEELLSPVGRYGLTLFHLCVWHNFYDAVEHMLCDGKIEGEEINLPDHKGYGLTPFLLACLCGNLSMVRLLLEHGADVSASDKRGMNAYHFLAYPRFEGLELASASREHTAEQRGQIAGLLTCDINKKDENGLTPLARILSTDYCSDYTWPLIGIFLDKGAETDYVDEDGNTLLMMALVNNHKTAALKLIRRCPDMINTANKKGVSPIRHTVSYQNRAMYLALIDHGAAPADSAFIDMFPLSQITSNAFSDVYRDNKDGLDIALYLTEKMVRQADLDDDDELGEITDIFHNALIADPDAHVLDIFHKAGLNFTMPVHCYGERLCLRDKCLRSAYGIGVVRKLAQFGVDLDTAVIYGQTPANIIAAQECGRSPEDESYFEEAAEFFSKESMEQLDNSGEAAVHRAAKKGHTGMLKTMIEKGVDINLSKDAPAQAGTTPLHEACAYGHPDAVKLLIAADADDTLKNLDGETPAHFAVMNKKNVSQLTSGQREQLLKELKHLDIPRNDGKTPFMLLEYSTRELLPLFLDRGADVNHTDNNGMTALMLNTDKDLVKELIRAGADINLADNEGNTALHHALEDYAEGTARYLVKKGANYNCPNNEGKTPFQIAAEKGFETVLELMTDIE